jgi:HPt (histidine-containing phosphotransfer) domain-containing protein
MDDLCTFANLELITGGDPALDIDVLETFLTTSRDYIVALQVAHRENNNDAWQSHAHAMKGSCYNIGADSLAEICQTAQSHLNAPYDVRADILQKIENEFAVVERAAFHHIHKKKQPSS